MTHTVAVGKRATRLFEQSDSTSLQSSFGFATVALVGKQGLVFAGLAVVARLLQPGDFGLYAVALAATGLAAVLADGGLGVAIVSAKKLSAEAFASAFWMNVGVCSCVGVIVAVISSPLANAFGHPELRNLLLIGAIGIVFGFGGIHLGLLERNLRYRQLAVVEISSVLLAQAATIVAALMGAGALSLVIGPTIGAITLSVLLLVAVGYAPKPRFRWAEVGPLWGTGKFVIGFNLVNFASRNADNVALAGLGSVTQAGLYSRAYSLMLLPVQQVAQVVARVTYPHLSSLQSNVGSQRQDWLRSLRGCWFLGLPVAAAMSLHSQEVATLVLGSQWGGAGVLLSVLAISIPFQLAAKVAGSGYQAFGMARRQMWVGLLNSSIVVASIAISVGAGAIAVASAVSAALCLTAGIALLDLATRISIPAKVLLGQMGPYLGSVVVMVIVDLGANFLLRRVSSGGIWWMGVAAISAVAYLLTLAGARRGLIGLVVRGKLLRALKLAIG